MASPILFNRGARCLGDGTTVWGTADIRALLLKSGTPDPDWDFVSDLTPGTNELTVSGYARQALTGEAITTDDTNNLIKYDADDPTFAALATGETAHWLVLFDNAGGADSARVLIAAYPINDPTGYPTTGSDFIPIFDASGCFTLGAG